MRMVTVVVFLSVLSIKWLIFFSIFVAALHPLYSALIWLYKYWYLILDQAKLYKFSCHWMYSLLCDCAHVCSGSCVCRCICMCVCRAEVYLRYLWASALCFEPGFLSHWPKLIDLARLAGCWAPGILLPLPPATSPHLSPSAGITSTIMPGFLCVW